MKIEKLKKINDQSTFGKRLKFIRKHLKMTQRDFAEELKVNNKTISDIEQNRRRPLIEFLEEIYHRFDVNLEYLIIGRGAPFMGEDQLSPDRNRFWDAIQKDFFLKHFVKYLVDSEMVKLYIMQEFDGYYKSESSAIDYQVEESKVKHDKQSILFG